MIPGLGADPLGGSSTSTSRSGSIRTGETAYGGINISPASAPTLTTVAAVAAAALGIWLALRKRRG